MKQKSIIFMGRRWGVNNSLQGKIDQGYYKNYYSVKTGKRYKVVCLKDQYTNFSKDSPPLRLYNGICIEIPVIPGKETEITKWLEDLGYSHQLTPSNQSQKRK